MRKIRLFLMTTLVLISSALTSWAVSEPYSGSPSLSLTQINGDYDTYGLTEEFDGYYVISSAEDLYKFAELVNSGVTQWQSAKAVLTDDIVVNLNVPADGILNDATMYSWTPIGTIEKNFKGTFDGNGHTISGLYFDNKTNNNYPKGGGFVGLIGYANGATIQNVGVIDSYIKGQSRVGGICGYATDGSETTITNCYNTGTVSGYSDYVGGICGTVKNTSKTIITNCYNTGRVSSSGKYVGGICGYLSTITNCHNTGTVSGSGDYVGGICGCVGKQTNCYNTGTVMGQNNIGGICGQSGIQTDCYNTGTVSGSGDYVGGICGYYGTQTNCYNTGTVSGSSNVGGICGYGGITNTINCYYLSSCGSQNELGTSITTEEFESGEITYLLNGRISDDNKNEWRQNLDNSNVVDAYPVLDKNHHVVYASQPCATAFSNNEGALHPHSSVDEITGYCSDCGRYCTEATLVDDTYQIGNAAQLYWFAQLVNEGETSAKAILTADITVNTTVLNNDGTLNGTPTYSWTPIGNSNKKYTGTFDGNYHTISGLYFSSPNVSSVGLIGYAGSFAKINNVGVIDSYLQGRSDVGGICGFGDRTNTTNCYNTGTVSGSGSNVGGIYGYTDGSTISNCYNTGTVSGSGDNVGGICGYSYDINAYQTNCYNTGTVSGSKYVGGICGYCYDANTSQTYCYNTGTVSGSTNYVGGICGYKGNQTNCYNIGTVTCSGSNVGGISGYNGNVSNCYYSEGCGSKNSLGVSASIEEFASGRITYLLNGKNSSNNNTWRQNLDGDVVDAYPVLDKNHAVVYVKHPCTSAYCNTSDGVEQHSTKDLTGRCSACGIFIADAPSMVTESNYSSYNLSAEYIGYYIISEAVDLYWFANWVNNGHLAANAVLTADITVNTTVIDADGALIGTPQYSWTPIGKVGSGSNYNGIFDGNHHTISGLYFDNTTNSNYPNGGNYVGLIGCCGEATIKNVGVINSYLRGYHNVGGISGSCGERSTIENCYNSGTITATATSYSYAGGISGQRGTQKNCHNTGLISGDMMIGGICGEYGIQENCYNTGRIVGSSYAGGIGGYYGTQTNCHNTGTISGRNMVGGICSGGGTITNCYNTGTIAGGGVSSSDSYYGGICGHGGNGTITNCYNTGAVTGRSCVGGICGAYGTQTNCFSTGTVSLTNNFTSVGGICGSSGTQDNCYYLEGCGSQNSLGVSVTAAEFASGKIGYLLNNNNNDESNNNAWHQNLYSDDYPLLDITHNLVSGYIEEEGDTYTVVGDMLLATNYEIAAGKTLIVPAGTSLTTTGEAVITNNGTLFANGTVAGNNLAGDNGSYIFDQLAATDIKLNKESYTYKHADYTLTAGLDVTIERVMCGKTFTFDESKTTVEYADNFYVGESAKVTWKNTNGSSVGKTFKITPKTLTISNIKAENKIYDGTDATTVSYTADVFSGDNVTFGNAASFTKGKAAGDNKVVTFNYSMSGDQAYNYVFAEPSGETTANIAKRELEISSITAAGKEYDGNTATTVTIVASNIVDGDVVEFGTAANFADKNAGNNKDVNFEFTKSGADADNYKFKTTTGTAKADITPVASEVVVTIVLANNTVIYNRTEQTLAANAQVSCNNTLYDLNSSYAEVGDIAHEVKGTKVGEYVFGWSNNSFTNQDNNFANVRFDVTDGKLTIQPCTNHQFDDFGQCTVCGEYMAPEEIDGVYQIASAAHLYWFADWVNQGNLEANAVLTADIVVNSQVLAADGSLNGDGSNFRTWTPIGIYDEDEDIVYSFKGTFDGDNHTISGLYLADYKYYVGLFGIVEEATIKNVGIVDSYFSGLGEIGGICGYAKSNSTITNCYNTGTVSCEEYEVGGICGYLENSTITNCHNTGTINSGEGFTGGICGYAYGNNTISNCYNTGSITSKYGAGGICGVVSDNSAITNCHNEGTVSCEVYDAGGICGDAYENITITNCYNTGTINSGEECAGGICGYFEGECTITNCFNTGTVTGPYFVGGVCCVFTDELELSNNFYLAGCATVGEGEDAVVQNGIGVGEDEEPLADVEGVTAATASEFASGRIAYLLNGSEQGSGVWYQTLFADETPVLNAEHNSITGYITEEGSVITVTGDVVVASDYEVANGKTLSIPAGASLTTTGSAVVTNNGTIVAHGTLAGNNLEGNGDFIYGGHIDAADFAVGETNFIYKGSAYTVADGIEFTVSRTICGKEFTYGDEYTVSYADNINAGQATISLTNNNDAENVVSRQFTISPVADEVVVTVTLADKTLVYNGAEQTYSATEARSVEADNELYNLEWIAESGNAASVGGTNVDEYAFGWTEEMFSNTSGNFSNVTFNVTDGKLIIAPKTGVVVTITENSNEVVYNTEEQSVNGYTVSISDELGIYTEDDFNFSGSAVAAGTTVGTYPMELSADNFSNTNANYADVQFEIVDGALTITKAPEAPNKPEANIETRFIVTQLVELPDDWKWADEQQALEEGDNVATANYAGADKGNYEVESAEVNIKRLPCPHDQGDDVLYKLEPTCTHKGYTGNLCCKLCGVIRVNGDSIPALGHAYDTVVVAVTCTTDGYTELTCTRCGDVTRIDIVPTTGHTAAEAVAENLKPATCTEAGSLDSVVYCSVCNTEISRKTVEIKATGHTAAAAVAENLKAATCTEAGSVDSVVYCSVCNAEISRRTVEIKATGHTAGKAVAENLKAATCTEAGSVDSVVYCSVCNTEISRKTVEIKATGHTAGKAVAENLKAATCTEAGSVDSVVYCSVCNTELSRKTVEIKATGHTAGKAVAENVKEATCTEAGSVDSVVYCSVCKEELSRKTVEIEATGHMAAEAVAENLKAATCTEAGSVDSVVYCSACNAEISRKTVEIPATGHIAGEAVIENVVAATYTAAGSYDSVVYCTVCKEELSRVTIEVPQLVKPSEAEIVEVVVSQVNYTVGDSLNLDGGKLVIATSDSTTAEVVITPEMVSGFNPDSVGVQTVTVSFEIDGVPYTTTFDVTVKDIAKPIEAEVVISQINYTVGDSLNLEGGKLIFATSDSTTAEVVITPEMISGFNPDSVGVQTVTVSFEIDGVPYTTTFDVEVKEAEVIEIVAKSIAVSAKPAKVEYKQGEALDVTGGKITVTFSDNTTAEVELKADMVSGFVADKVGEQKLTISYTVDGVTLTATFEVTVKADDTAINEDEAAAVNIYAYGNTIVVENATADIFVFDSMGRMISRVAANADRTEIQLDMTGVYVVKTGNTTKRVMIN